MRQLGWEQFSTEAVYRPQRVHRWNDYGSETLCDMVVDPADRDGFNARLARIELGALGFVAMRSTGARASSGLGGASRWASPQRDALSMVVVEAGACTLRQGSASSEVGPGGLFLLDLTRPWQFDCEGDMVLQMVKVPFAELAPRVDDPGRLLGRSFGPNVPAASVTAALIGSISRMLRDDPRAGAEPALSGLILDAVTLLYHREAGQRDEAERGDLAALRRAAVGRIARSLEDPELSVASLAAALSVSPRQLQRAFALGGETPVQAILAQRLDRAAARILARGAGRTTILDVALSVGFNDASHFSRSFARRFGVPPRRYAGTSPSRPRAC